MENAFQVYDGNEEYIYVSYSHADQSVVMPIVRYLCEEKYRIWIDKGIMPGMTWVNMIAQKIEEASLIIAFITFNSLNSSNFMDELSFARMHEKKILFICLEDIGIPLSFQMRYNIFQWLHINKFLNRELFFEKLKTLLPDSLISQAQDVYDTQKESIGDLNYKKSDVIEFGYYSDGSQLKSIKWLILDREDDKYLLLSKEGIAVKPYHSQSEYVSWENSSIRHWLNSHFLKQSFSDEEKNRILPKRIGNSYVRKTIDKVFLLSEDEVNCYFETEIQRVCKASEQLKKLGALVFNNNTCIWWLRSTDDGYIVAVGPTGIINRNGIGIVTSEGIVVRPAIWVKGVI